MAIDLSNFAPTDFNYDSLDHGGMPEPGKYHVRLLEEEFNDEKTPAQILSFVILAGSVAGQAGKNLKERLFLEGKDDEKTKKAIARAMGWGKRMGIYSEADMKAMAPLDFSKAIGKEFIVDVVPDTYEDRTTGQTKETARINYMGIWRVDHPDAPECPRAGKPSSNGAAAKPAANKNPKPGATKKGAGDVEDI